MPCIVCRRFKLLCQIRVTYRFATLEGRRQLVANRLMAFVVYMQANPSHEELATFFMGETELISELISLVEADAGVDEAIRMLALKALAVQARPVPTPCTPSLSVAVTRLGSYALADGST